MKRFAALAVVVLAALASVTAAQAAVITNQIIPINLIVFVPCANGGTGELVDLSGNLHDMFATTVNGNHFSMKYMDNPQGVSGTGETTGDSYQATGVTQGQTSGNVGFEDTYINNFRIIGHGPGNNFLVHETYHVTVNANGDVTASVDNFSVDCK
jgi:hypothetical protein